MAIVRFCVHRLRYGILRLRFALLEHTPFTIWGTPFTITIFETFRKQKKHPKKSANFGLKCKKPLYFKGFLVYQYRGTEVVGVTGVEI